VNARRASIVAMIDRTLDVDGRTVAFTDFGPDDGAAVLWCHGGPGSRREPTMIPDAAEHGLRRIGIDRPGYGRSTPRPERDIASWVPDAIAVADACGLDRFVAVGVSTGGAYALALAANAAERVQAVVACCALTDMRWPEGRATMTAPETAGIWTAPDREAALAIALEQFGADGSGLLSRASDPDTPPLPPSDLAVLTDPDFVASMADGMREMFAQGVAGYTDDRRADGPGWGCFDVNAVACPVVVLHGAVDPLVPPVHARHTAEIVPGATLSIVDDLGHFSIMSRIVPTVRALIDG
jgi:pimeloyl-ACP methyl ester carboxylesterase